MVLVRGGRGAWWWFCDGLCPVAGRGGTVLGGTVAYYHYSSVPGMAHGDGA